MQNVYAELAELRRLIENIVRYGTITEIDYDTQLVRVQTGGSDDEENKGNTTDWIQWNAGDAGNTTEWDPPSLGEQVTLLSPGGNLANATAYRGKYSDQYPPPSTNPTLRKKQCPDGAVFEYDHASHSLKITLPGGSSTLLKTDQYTVDAKNTVFTGDVLVQGNQTNAQNVTVNQSLSVHGQGGTGGASATFAGIPVFLEDAIIGGISFIGHRHQTQAGGGISEVPE